MMFNMRMKVDPDLVDWKTCRVSQKDMAKTILGGFDRDKVADLLCKWFASLNLAERKRIVPLAYNWPRTRDILVRWLGYDVFADLFSEDYRDVLIATHFINDRECVKAEPVIFSKQVLSWIATKLNVSRPTHGGNPTEDCLTIAQVYRRLLTVV